MSGGGNHHEAESEAEPEVAGKQSPGTMLSEQETSKGGSSQPADTERTSQQANNGSSHSSSPMPPSNGSRSHAPPIITNSVPNRPPSTTSMHSTGSAGPRSTTATSRRGGRTRSRSPPMMMNQRPPSTGPPAMEPYGGGGMEDRRAQPPSPANPSAAAAAAAAAAKSITRNPQPPPSSWYDSPDAREREYRRSRGVVESSRYHPSYYEGGPPASLPPRHHWPEDEAAAAAAAAAGGRPPSRNRYQPRTRPVPEDHYGYREAYSSYRGRGGRGEPYPPPPRPYEEEYERRYADPRYDDRRRQPGPTSPMPPGYDYRVRGQQQQQHPPPPPRHHREDPYAEGARAEAGAPMMVKRTTRVIGTPTPIHMPRAPDTSSRNSRSGPQSNTSIFRGRPGSDGPKQQSRQAEGTAAAAAAAAAEKPLMSLRSHSNSFEEKSSKDDTKRSGDPLSPEAPPQIHHSHHQSAAESTLFFEPQRSPRNSATAGPPQPTSSIDMAPSFTLFNQSFDSIGDTANFFSVSGPLDSALQSTSFGVAPTGSEDKTTELHFTNSTGNFSQQILQGSTFEMSPSNSFGNGPGVMRSRSGNIVVLGGGQDNRAGSPSQLLDMYSRSYSGGGPVPGPSPRSTHQGGGPPFLEDTSHLRMSGGGAGGGSLAAPTLQPNAYGGRSFDVGPALHYRPTGFGHPEIVDGGPGFYLFLKRYKSAFRECSFLLPGLKAALLEAPDVKEEADETPKRHTNRNGGDPYGEPSPQEMAVALRRVASAVCAFGGTNLGERASGRTSSARSSAGGGGGGKQSIFREKPGDAATVTPNSSAGTSPGSHRARQRAKYDEMLPSRYYENDNRLSWEFEEHPPIDEMGRDEEEADELKREEGTDKDDGKDGEGDKKDHDDDDDTDGGSGDGEKTGNGSKDGDQPKMRYRCKLCGQPKQNHTCPYQQSLARSIGVMIYPAVNAFTASEPGSLAPALSEMNNFISSGDSVSSMDGGSPSRPTPDRMRGRLIGVPPGTAQVTPESLRGNSRGASCTSPMTTPQRARTPVSSRRSTTRPGLDMQRRLMGGPPPSSPSSRGRKRGHSQLEDQGDLLFVEAVDLKPEQFRMVTASKIVSSPEAFTYPALPLPYAQRKRLSDNLFSLSKEVPQLTDECAAVLREAREKDMWDLAVAELMTQVVVVVHCHDGDSRFEGLRRYLMTLGISC